MTAMSQGWHVARREMRERSRSRGFRIGFVLMLLVVVVMVVLPGMLDSSDATKRVGIAGTTSALVERALTDRAPSGENTVHHVRFDSVATGEAALRDEGVDVLVVDGRRLEWRGEPDAELQALVIGALQVATVQQRAAVAGVDAAIAARILSPVSVENVRIGAVSGRTADDDAAVALMTVALLAAIVIYGNLVLTGVVEEKSSRVVEVLLARVPARALLGGKVVGIGLLGFAQLAVTAAAALVALMVVDTVDLPAVTGGVLAWVLVWFVLGYALYAMLYGALGSLASRTEDAQAVAGPVGYVLVAGYWASFMALSADADGPWARILSLFPPTAPLAMPGRIALGATQWWEAPAAVLLTLAAIAGLVSFAGRVYANAVLRTGAVLRVRDAWHHTDAGERRTPHGTPALRMTTIWAFVLGAAGVVASALVYILTADVIWSVVPLLLSVAAARRVREHR